MINRDCDPISSFHSILGFVLSVLSPLHWSCRKGGNPFNTSVIPSPSAAPAPEPTSAPAPFIGRPPSPGMPAKKGNQSSAEAPHPAPSQGRLRVGSVILISGIGTLVVIAIASLCLCLWRCSKRKQMNEAGKRLDMGVYANSQGAAKSKESSRQPNINMERRQSMITYFLLLNQLLHSRLA